MRLQVSGHTWIFLARSCSTFRQKHLRANEVRDGVDSTGSGVDRGQFPSSVSAWPHSSRCVNRPTGCLSISGCISCDHVFNKQVPFSSDSSYLQQKRPLWAHVWVVCLPWGPGPHTHTRSVFVEASGRHHQVLFWHLI